MLTAAQPQDVAADRDEHLMAATIALGRRQHGLTAPNPAVGALVVRDGVIVGRGATRKGGRPHAETEALAQAGELARGATLYVSLEPCAHFGVTPPCAQATITAGIARVVSALEDPDPRVAGQGHRMMREAGVEVVVGVGAAQARRAHLGHILRVTEGRPQVTLKLAETADGFAAGGPHDRRLHITGIAANNYVQMLRATHDAIMVGIGTVLADDPLLTVRLPGLDDRQPLRVVLDSNLQLPLRSRLVTTAAEVPVLVICAADADATAEAALAQAGIAVVRVARDDDGHLDLAAALHVLAGRGVTRVFSEGGPQVAGRLIGLGLADECILLTAPKPFAREGVASLSETARRELEDGRHYRLVEDGFSGVDRLRRYEHIS
ncbi:bifunctional diaminohydroxyphosphoribosylaminopyrimidine deaminase/5-amino-6-(5-phosphoribosylamino)uracil reductase RibD [Methylocella sp. CPCC 101449]|uniref:bifunctional diaminohydroxyphosphoribosylaminopyrimidine deaminase/5-amino-6-(5-phosphoribosylamino)uracil reductase RibD n=1 Tax=Methylocella sp. CPCC 101449 TaxID=2987531 RepID=UPI00288E4CC0|nr:bifunctional diaminohydroxyphosphoribosylaminopyrimidine deaminase/5-amino-6-(5-phosphoribosylamino)uracil reductase RibD [Methylocella sp. CPCC 101449]MDT2022490.1 bifunctional diaminohydroxyphosphoribosylaminopyrimidine deaminase/5-amino-6-(5-phosphoribosylamino)uracil reductase RibD [Methylocella sp. CPCC 101449]